MAPQSRNNDIAKVQKPAPQSRNSNIEGILQPVQVNHGRNDKARVLHPAPQSRTNEEKSDQQALHDLTNNVVTIIKVQKQDEPPQNHNDDS